MVERVRCEERERLSSWVSLALDGRLAADLEAEMEQHLATCPECRAQATAMRSVSMWLARMPMLGPSYGFALRVERRLAERSRHRQVLRGMALLTSSMSIVGIGVAAILVLGLGLATLLWLGPQPAWQQAEISMPQVVSGLGLMGKGASLFLKDALLRYGLPVVLVVGGCLAVMGGVWVWLFSRRSKSERDGYA